MAESLTGLLRQIAKESNNSILACTVVNTNPLQLKFQGDMDTIIFKESPVIPDRVLSLSKGNTAYIIPYGDNLYFVLGKG